MKDFEKVIALKSAVNSGEKFEFEFFWKGPFSQWADQGFTKSGIRYDTAEHWMMAEKAKLFNDKKAFQKIINARSPKIAKSIGREIKNFNEKIWAKHRYDIVLAGNRYKFTQSEEYKNILLATGDKILVEASPVDTIWGIGLAEDNPLVLDPRNWNGLNLLGFVLTDLRKELKSK